jgi:hypothetical protein
MPTGNRARRGALASVIILATCLASAAPAGSLKIESPPQRVALLELYTSEGCSSCPPADRWVSSLKNEPGLWKTFIPVSFHVDYWDYIGWPDRFASPAYSARQYQHAADQSMRTVYTPGFFLNGREWRWRDGDLCADAAGGPAGTLGLEVADGVVELRFEGEPSGRDLSASVALLGFGIETRVEAGENVGRTLRHDFVVLAVSESPLKRRGAAHRATLKPPASGIAADRYALVAWVHAKDSQVPLQAAGGWWD